MGLKETLQEDRRAPKRSAPKEEVGHLNSKMSVRVVRSHAVGNYLSRELAEGQKSK